MNNLDRWNAAKFTRSSQINAQVKKILANRTRYEYVEKLTGVPWDVIAVIHVRESSANFAGVLHNGEHIIGTGKKTKLVPKGRGPFSTWEEAAVDALMNCAPYLGKNKDWSLGNTLDLLEKYNGLGYQKKGLPSPYLWAGTDQYVKGKYVADGKFDANAVDKQLGTAPLLMKIRSDEASIPVDIYDGKYHKEVYEVQVLLDKKKYPEVGDTDGKYGSKTATAIMAFRRENGLPISDRIDPAFLTALAIAPDRVIDSARANATVSDLRKEDVPEIKQTDQTKLLGQATTGMGMFMGGKKLLEEFQSQSEVIRSIIDTIQPVYSFIQDNVWLILGGVGVFVAYKSGVLQRIRLFKHQEGQDVSA